MARRKRWGELSEAYRRRLERQGITARTHQRADLNRARGHVSTRPVGAIDRATIERVLTGEGTVGEVTGTDLLARFTWPDWVPRTIDNQGDGFTYAVEVPVAAALSQLPDPRTWDHVAFSPRVADEPWEMVVYIKRRTTPRRILIPGGGEPGSGAKQVLDIVSALTDSENARRERRRASLLFFDVYGTDQVIA